MLKNKKSFVAGMVLGILAAFVLGVVLFNALEKLPGTADFDFNITSVSEINYGDELEVDCSLKTGKCGIFWISTGPSVFVCNVDDREQDVIAIQKLGPMKRDLSESIKISGLEKGMHKITVKARFSLAKYKNSEDWQDYSYSKTIYVEVK